MQARWRSASRRWCGGAALALLAMAGTAGAQGPGPKVSGSELARFGFFQDFDELDLEALLETAQVEVGVASRGTTSVERAPGAVTVVTEAQMRALGARTLEDVLRSLPGFDVQRDTLGRPRVAVRGAGLSASAGGGDEVLVLLNGQRLNEAVTGSATSVNLELSVEHLSRIEVWRGVGTALYGAGAARAVIDLISTSPRDFQGIQLQAELGSFGSQRYGLRLAQTFKGLSFSGLVLWSDSDGPSLDVPADRQTARDLAAPPGSAPVSLAPSSVQDGREVFQATYQLGFRDLWLQWHSKREETQGFVGFADTLGRDNALDLRQDALALGYTRRTSQGRFEARGTLMKTRTGETLNTAPPGFGFETPEGQVVFPSGVYQQDEFDTSRLAGELSFERRSGTHALAGGLELAHERTEDLYVRSNLDYLTGQLLTDVSDVPGAVEARSRDTFALWLQDGWSRGRTTLTGSLRYDAFDDVDDQLAPRAALQVRLGGGFDARALYARGWRVPSFQELAFDLPGRLANPALRASVSDTAELALVRRWHDGWVSANGFWSREQDPIRLPGEYDPAVAQAWANVGDLTTRGVELEGQWSFGLDGAAFANLTWQQPRQEVGGVEVDAPGVPSLLANAGVSLPAGRHLLVSPTLYWRGSRPRAPGDARADAEAYALLDVVLRTRQLWRTLELSATLRDAFDEGPHDPSPRGGLPGDYPRSGRAFFVQAGYKF